MTGREMTYPETGRKTGTRKIGGRNTGRQVAGSQATGGHTDRRHEDRQCFSSDLSHFVREGRELSPKGWAAGTQTG